MDDPQTLALLLAPIVLIDLGGRVAALVSLHRAERVRFDNKWIWGAIVVLVNFGWVGWFLAGRER